MKALTLHQPWASLIATGAKRVETRGWPAPPWVLGQRIAIHAAKGVGPGGESALRARFDMPLFREALADAGLDPDTLPRGAVIATAVVKRCAPITEDGARALAFTHPAERAFGNYSLDEGPRWAWVLRDVEALAEPVQARGHQKIWDWDPDTVEPERLLDEARP